MKKSVSIHLNGHLFHLEEDGYQELSTYLQSVKTYFAAYPDSTEIVDDIEARLAEKFGNRKTKKPVVTTSEILQAISEMGHVEDFAAAEEKETEIISKSSKRLFRDKEHGIIAGVAAGIGNYFGIDPVWIRIAFILLSFVYLWGVALYLILWLIVPAAKTAADKIEMQGAAVTVANIEQVLRDGIKKARVPEKMSVLSKWFRSIGTIGERFINFLGKTFGYGFRGILRLLAILIGIWGIIVSVAFSSALLAGLIALSIGADAAYFEPSFVTFFPENTFFPYITAIFFTILIPLLFILSLSFWFLRRKGLFRGGALGVLAGLWIISFGTTIGMSALVVPAVWREVDEQLLAYETAKVTQEVPIPEQFTGIAVEDWYEVRIQKGAEYAVSIQGAPDVFEETTFEVVANTLEIHFSEKEKPLSGPEKIKLFSFRSAPLITITMPALENISVARDAHVSLEGFADQDLALTLSGGSDISLEENFQKVTATVENNGHLFFKGRIEDLTLQVEGSSTADVSDIGKAQIRSERGSSVNIDGDVQEADLFLSDHSVIEMQGNGSRLSAILRNGSFLRAEDFAVEEAKIEATRDSSALIYAENDTGSSADFSSSIRNLRTDNDFDEFRTR